MTVSVLMSLANSRDGSPGARETQGTFLGLGPSWAKNGCDSQQVCLCWLPGTCLAAISSMTVKLALADYVTCSDS